MSSVRIREGAGPERELEAAALFVYVGLAPSLAYLDGQVKLDSGGRLVTDAWLRTGLAGICAAGSVRAGSAGRAAASAGDGAAAAVAVDRYLRDRDWRNEH